ncbi:hypothetical protein M3J09_007909 [Ascochyta lentis]
MGLSGQTATLDIYGRTVEESGQTKTETAWNQILCPCMIDIVLHGSVSSSVCQEI